MISKTPTNYLVPPNTPNSPANIIVPPNTPNSSIVSPNSPAASFYSPLAPPNTPNTPSSEISSSSYHTAITINGLLSPASISFSPPSPVAVPPNTPTSPFIFQSIINDINNSSNNSNSNNNIGSSFNINSNGRKFLRKNSRERNVTIDSVLANSLNNIY
ncbi:DNA-directed RNA polymerase II subunit 1-like [Rhizophagus clarus]|nr:DNA-directed RNA polymerase II subunit 1-like [Rhizophagus clarus]